MGVLKKYNRTSKAVSISITTSESGRCISIQAENIASLEEAEGVLAAAAQAVAEVPQGRRFGLLFDLRHSPNRLTTLENHQLAYEFIGGFETLKHLPIAVVRSEPDMTYNFSERLVENLGFNVRFFVAVDRAIDWLESLI